VLAVNLTYLGTAQTNFSVIKQTKNTRYRKNIKCITLNDALKSLKNVAIKCDCEGAEHKIFTKDADLSNVYVIEMEYHTGLQKLLTVLKNKGFKVKLSKQYYDKYAGYMGYLYAWK